MMYVVSLILFVGATLALQTYCLHAFVLSTAVCTFAIVSGSLCFVYVFYCFKTLGIAKPSLYVPIQDSLLFATFTVSPLFLFSFASRFLEVTTLSIMLVIEPLTAMLVGLVCFHDKISPIQAVGFFLAFLSFVVANLELKTKSPRPNM